MAQQFEAAVDAVVSGDVATLKALIEDNPSLVTAQSELPHKATLLHYLGANGVENERQMTPANAVEVAQTLIDAGAEVDAHAETYGGGTGQTTLNLLVTSAHPAKAGDQADLVDVLCRAGAAVNGLEDNESPIRGAVAFMYPSLFLKHQVKGAISSIKTLVQHGARLHNLYAAAALGELGVVREAVQKDANEERLVKAFIYACLGGQIAVVEWLLEQGVDVNASCAQGQTGLHVAAGVRHKDLVQFLIERGADTTCQDTQYQKTPLKWAEHFEENAVTMYLKRT